MNFWLLLPVSRHYLEPIDLSSLLMEDFVKDIIEYSEPADWGLQNYLDVTFLGNISFRWANLISLVEEGHTCLSYQTNHHTKNYERLSYIIKYE